jgi:hypothetical protein
LVGYCTGQVGKLCATQYAVDVPRSLLELSYQIGAIRNQSARFGIKSRRIERRQAQARGQSHDETTVSERQRAGAMTAPHFWINLCPVELRGRSLLEELCPMKAHLLAVTMSAALLTCAAIPVTAQQPPGAERSAPDYEGMMRGGPMGRGMMGDRGMMGHGMMGPMGERGHRDMMHPLAMRMIFALMDADGDGKISLEEWQAGHQRLFKAMDTDRDGTVTLEEMEAFMHGARATR